jgi:plasmid stability protein
MVSVTFENMDDGTLAALAARADEHGMTIEDYLKAALASPPPPDRKAIAAELNAIRARTVPARLAADEAVSILHEIRSHESDRALDASGSAVPS